MQSEITNPIIVETMPKSEIRKLRGFGMEMDLQNGRIRNWYIDSRGIKRWHDTDEVKQD